MEALLGFLAKYLAGPILAFLETIFVKTVLWGIDWANKAYSDMQRKKQQKVALVEYEKAIQDKAPIEERRKKFEDLFNSIS